MKRIIPNQLVITPALRRSSLPALALLASIALMGLATTGCQVLAYRGPNGERFTRSSFGANTSIASLTVQSDTNGLRRVELQGYQNDSSQTLSAVTSAAISAALKSVKQ